MGGLARKMPQTAIVFLVGTLSLAGVPLFAGFASKEEVLGAVWAGGLPCRSSCCLSAAFLTAFYMFRVVFLAFFGTRDHRHRYRSSDTGRSATRITAHGAGGTRALHDAPFAMTGPLWVLAIIAMAHRHLFHAAPAARGVRGARLAHAGGDRRRPVGHPARVAHLPASARSAPTRWRVPSRRSAARRSRGFWLDDIFVGDLSLRAADVLAALVGWIDRYLVDGVLNVVSAWTLDGGDGLRRIQTGKVQDYVFAVGFGLLALMAWIGVGW